MDSKTLARLERRVEEGLRRARRTGVSVLASVTGLVENVDPVGVAAASCREGEDWFSFEQPDRDRYAVAGLGTVRTLRAQGEDRFSQVSRQWRAIAANSVADQIQAPLGSGLIAFGGFAFASDGGSDPEWEGFPPAALTVPEVSLARAGSRTAVTLTADVAPDDTPEGIMAGVAARAAELREAPLPLFDPSPVGRYSLHSAMPPAHYEQAVRAAVERIGAGEVEKVVLAREVDVTGPADYDPATILGPLRTEFPSCFVFAVRRREGTFLAASPEVLVRREGQRASTVALAGSIGRSADPAVDDHLGERLLRSAKDREENAIVARAISRILEPHSVWVTSAPEPIVVKVANIQHLATPIRAQLTRPLPVVELAGALHPTPAVGGEPRRRATEMIPALEGLDRGWYAGAVGWTDAAGDGEFCVALRCALLRGATARVYAGCGIVRDSDPAAELAETEIKLGALLPLLAG